MQLIPPEALQRLRARVATIAQFQLILESLQLATRAEVAALGIDPDLAELDLERGLVMQKEPADADALDQAD